MPRYIDADALGIGYANPKVFNSKEYARGWNSAIEIINSAPTVSPDEVRGVGEWKMWEDYYGSNVYQCSVCGADWDMIDGTPEDNDMNYCPHCGARMVGVQDALS